MRLKPYVEKLKLNKRAGIKIEFSNSKIYQTKKVLMINQNYGKTKVKQDNKIKIISQAELVIPSALWPKMIGPFKSRQHRYG